MLSAGKSCLTRFGQTSEARFRGVQGFRVYSLGLEGLESLGVKRFRGFGSRFSECLGGPSIWSPPA